MLVSVTRNGAEGCCNTRIRNTNRSVSSTFDNGPLSVGQASRRSTTHHGAPRDVSTEYLQNFDPQTGENSGD